MGGTRIAIHVITQRIGSAEVETAPVRAVVTDGVVDTTDTLGTIHHGTNAILVERIEFTDGFRRQFVHTTQFDGTPVVAFQTDVGQTGEVSVTALCPAFSTVVFTIIQLEPLFQFESGFHAGTEVFHSTEAQTVVDVFTHFYVMTGFLDETGVNNTVNGDVGLCVSHAGSGTQDCQCY